MVSSNNQPSYSSDHNTSRQQRPKERSSRYRSDSASLISMEKGMDSSSSSSNGTWHPTTTSSSSLISKSETTTSILLQVLCPLLVAGLGMVLAGLLLESITQQSAVFKFVSEIYILVPALLGLKGNLEMTMASRLSSIANLGQLKSSAQRVAVFKANIALTQCQSVVVGFCASIFAAFINWINTGTLHATNTVMLAATSILTATLASLILGSIMMLIIIWSLDHNVNPDNIATPIAAALGDLITLYILYFISDLLYRSIDYFPLLCPILIVLTLLIAPLWWQIAAQDRHTRVALSEGWMPVILAMTISSLGGCILNQGVARFKGTFAVYQPLINGVGGNLAAIQASRMSTFGHMSSEKKKKSSKLPQSYCFNPVMYLFRSDIHARTARLLLALVVPCHLVFLFVLHLLHHSPTSPTLPFLISYLCCSLLQVLLLLYLAQLLISWMWYRGVDPDNSAIPYLTALGDLGGTLFLFIAFSSLNRFQLDDAAG